MIEVSRDTTCNTIDTAKSISILKRYLNNEAEIQKTDIQVSGTGRIEVENIKDSTIIVLDWSRNELWRYDIGTNGANISAKPGQGPGELNMAIDISAQGDKVFVSRGDRKITIFKCSQSSCAYEDSITIPLQLTSMDILNNNKIIGIGTVPWRGEGTSDDGPDGALHILNREGRIVKSFGDEYDTNHFPVKDRMVRNASVKGLQTPASYVVTYGIIPRIYFYDENANIHDIYNIHNFSTTIFQYHPNELRLEITDSGSFSEVSNIEPIKDDNLLVSVKHHLGTVENKNNPKFKSDYYVINPEAQCKYFVGSDVNYTASGTELIPKNDFIVRIKNGSVSIIR